MKKPNKVGSFFATSVEAATLRTRKGTKNTYRDILGYVPAHTNDEGDLIVVLVDGVLEMFSLTSESDALKLALSVNGPDGLPVQKSAKVAEKAKEQKMARMEADHKAKMAKMLAMSNEAYLAEMLGEELDESESDESEDAEESDTESDTEADTDE